MFCSVDVLAHGSWKLLQELENPELKDLASKLPGTILHSRADNTVTKYLRAFRRWKTWATSHKLQPLPAKAHQFVLYLQHLAEESKSRSAIEEACNSVSWIHSTAGMIPPMSDPFVKATLEGLQRSLAKPVVKKEPISVAMLEAIVQDAVESDSLSDLRLATACLLSFSGFLHFSELINLRPCDFTFSDEMMKIRIVSSKTDQFRQGDELVVARTNTQTCPVAMLERYLCRTGTLRDDERPLFRPIQKTKRCEKLRESGRITYSCMRSFPEEVGTAWAPSKRIWAS